MTTTRRRALLGLPLLLPAARAAAQPSDARSSATQEAAYPGSRPVTLVVPFPPGGSVDGVARLLARALSEETGGTFVVENRAGGAGGAVGSAQVLRAPADGRTLLFNASILAVVPMINPNVSFDVLRDFAHVSLVADGPLLVSVDPGQPADSLGEFFRAVRAAPERFSFGTTGLGSAGHLAVEMLKLRAGLRHEVVAYRGGGPALSDLAAGNINLLADPMLSSLPLARAGRIKALAVTSRERTPLAPDIPTVAESGMEPLEAESWYGLWGPPGLEPSMLARLSGLVARVARSPGFAERLGALGFRARGTGPQAFRDFVAGEISQYRPVIEAAAIRVQ